MPKGERHSALADAKALAKRATTTADKGHLLKLAEAWFQPEAQASRPLYGRWFGRATLVEVFEHAPAHSAEDESLSSA